MPKRYLSVLDVGHGNGAVLRDEGGVVVFDTGRGAHVERHLKALGLKEVEALFLSHADSDHIGGAETLLLNKDIRICQVYLNPDSSKDTEVFRQLRVALSDAMKRAGTKLEPSLTTSTTISRKGAIIEVLYPPASVALGGVGGRGPGGNRLSSNSLSAAIRVTGAPNSAVLLGGDIEFECLAEWKHSASTPSAHALVFPHHGGLPGAVKEAEASRFAQELTTLVKPEIVVFSIHRSKYGLPLDEILTAVLKTSTKVRFVCTQLPERFRSATATSDAWSLHRQPGEKRLLEGTVEFEFADKGLKVRFRDPD